MAKPKRLFRYKVAEVYEGAEGRLEVGQTLIDSWHGKSHSYQVESNGDVSPYCYVTLIGEVTEPETLELLRGVARERAAA